jgi:hypothetical protein
MDNEELINLIQQLKDENEKLKNELLETKEHLKKYTAPSQKKIYYENNKEEIKIKVKEYKEKTNYTPTPEQKKKWARNAYLKKKEKDKLKELEIQII